MADVGLRHIASLSSADRALHLSLAVLSMSCTSVQESLVPSRPTPARKHDTTTHAMHTSPDHDHLESIVSTMNLDLERAWPSVTSLHRALCPRLGAVGYSISVPTMP